MSERVILPTPPQFQEIVERVTARDREYFEAHPHETAYSRQYVPGEFWPVQFPQSTLVIVREIEPGVRARIPILPRVPEDWEGEL